MAIPRRIVQTHRSSEIGAHHRETWRSHHPDFEYLFFDDDGCRAFIRRHLPALSPTYDRLPLPVQKADLFRYAVIHQLGGVYADVDTACRAPLHSYVDLERDHLVIGVEMTPDEHPGGIESYGRSYCFPVQYLQWTFAAPAGHPALGRVLQRIAAFVHDTPDRALRAWSDASPKFTLEMTGPIMFTQAIRELLAQPRVPAVTILHRHVWGAIPPEFRSAEILRSVKVAHLFAGSWKAPPMRNDAVMTPPATRS